MSQTIGNRIRFLRESKGWLQEDLAEKIGLGREALSGIENNRRQVKAEELSLLADFLDVSADQLLGRCPLPKVDLEKPKQEHSQAGGMRISVPAKNVEKFREVLLYILNKVGARPSIGETVLYKLIYFVDFDFYEKYEEQLIGATYMKNTYGPTPVEFRSIVNEMIDAGEIEQVKSKYFKKEQKKYLPHREARLEELSAREVKLIDEVIDRLADKNATQISEYSHGDVPWLVTEDQGIIDYETVFYRTAQYSVRRSQDEG
ncbi:MAG: hypothetical protein K940chlam7_00129 [Chlamydiae bacterium]|nr:hypothetical protein [Chlamydiota bacterium]